MAEPVRSPRHWRSLEERRESPGARQAAQEEFHPEALGPADPRLSRRHFMGLLGLAAAAASLGCEDSIGELVVPYTRRPREIVPGVATFYASTFPEGRHSCAVLVKTREGRPIHITGNDEHPRLQGKASPRALAGVLGLYDPDRLRSPRVDGRPASWEQALGALVAAFRTARDQDQQVLLLTGAVTSPTRQELLARLGKALPGLRHLEWEPAAGEGALEGAYAAFGTPVALERHLDQAKVILSLGADFLNGDDPEAVRAFTAQRRPPAMNRLWVMEGPMTLTGAQADHRLPLRPSRLAAQAFALARDLHLQHGRPLPPGTPVPSLQEDQGFPPGLRGQLLADLHRAGPEAVVLCGEAMPGEAHVATHLLNAMLGARAVRPRPARALATFQELETTVRAMAHGRYPTVLLWGVNPAYACPHPEAWAAAYRKVPNRAWIGVLEDESAAQSRILLPEHHWLEAWGDHAGPEFLTLQQPAIGPLHDTRQGEEVLLALLEGLGGSAGTDFHEVLKDRWRRGRPRSAPVAFERFWQAALHDGVVKAPVRPRPALAFQGSAVAPALARALRALEPDGLELLLLPGTQVFDGRHGNNAWLQELPDPVTKVTWGNPLSLAVADAKALGLEDGDLASLKVGGRSTRWPVIVQPGQAPGLLKATLGYGRATGGVAKGIGQNAYPLLDPGSRTPQLRRAVGLEKALGRRPPALTQNHHRMEGRDLVRSLPLAALATLRREAPDLASLYPDLTFPEHKWGMAIDLSPCTGCSACVLACQSENNIPTVGPIQVAKGREMHWLRIDRYYEGSEEAPQVVHQPMLCQHCDAAPCENVCPVNATSHSPDGLNQMTYNRCVGTRYCANNCPYKVRRFNFLEYNGHKREPESLVFNPEVSVRPRGVMEKCTFCVQRIQDGRMRAQAEHRPLGDGEIQPACAAACPGDAIVFGDLKDPHSRVAQLAKAQRGYQVLEELGARPAITYLAQVKNPAGQGEPP